MILNWFLKMFLQCSSHFFPLLHNTLQYCCWDSWSCSVPCPFICLALWTRVHKDDKTRSTHYFFIHLHYLLIRMITIHVVIIIFRVCNKILRFCRGEMHSTSHVPVIDKWKSEALLPAMKYKTDFINFVRLSINEIMWLIPSYEEGLISYFNAVCSIVSQFDSALYSNWKQRPSSLIELGAL